MKRLALIIVLFCTGAFSQDTTKPLLMAHFMPWFQTPSGHGYWGWHWTMNHYNPNVLDSSGHREIASHYYPLTGPYDSDDPNILEYQSLLMCISGIDGVLVDWYGMDNFADYAVLNTSTGKILAAMEKAHLRFGLVYEDQTIKHMIDGGSLTAGNALSRGKAVMTYAGQHYFASGSYLTSNGSPVLLTFGPQYFMNSSDWDTLFSALPSPPLFFTLVNRLAPVATGAFPWPPMADTTAQGVLTQTALNNFLNWFYGQAAAWPYVVAGAFPGFHDIYLQAGVGPSYGYLDAMDGFTMSSTLQQAVNHHPNVVQLITWNDYGEGTIIEPTAEFGYQYLEVVQAAKDTLDPTFPFQSSDLRTPLEIYNLRIRYASDAGVNSTLDRVFALVVAKQRIQAVSLMDSLLNATSVRGGEKLGTGYGGYYLQQNYPNPFNPLTIFDFRLPIETQVKLSIVDVLGREVAVLVDEKRGAGRYSVKFDGSTLSSGIYFCRIVAGNYSESRKMVVLK